MCRVFGLHTQSLPWRGPDPGVSGSGRGRGQAGLSEGDSLPMGGGGGGEPMLADVQDK